MIESTHKNDVVKLGLRERALICKTFVSQNIGEMAEWLKAVVLKPL